jgi:hypothetical protein
VRGGIGGAVMLFGHSDLTTLGSGAGCAFDGAVFFDSAPFLGSLIAFKMRFWLNAARVRDDTVCFTSSTVARGSVWRATCCAPMSPARTNRRAVRSSGLETVFAEGGGGIRRDTWKRCSGTELPLSFASFRAATNVSGDCLRIAEARFSIVVLGDTVRRAGSVGSTRILVLLGRFMSTLEVNSCCFKFCMRPNVASDDSSDK